MVNNIYKKINAIKSKLLALNLKKSGENKFSHFNYYELADLLPSIVKLCDEEGLVSIVSFDNENATLSLINCEVPDEVVKITSPMRTLDLKGCNEIQALGGVETYQRRYLYMAAFDIVEADTFDSIAGSEANEAKNKFFDMVSKQIKAAATEDALKFAGNQINQYTFTEKELTVLRAAYKKQKAFIERFTAPTKEDVKNTFDGAEESL
ncbi:MAG: ERF family protein [Rickettsiales bacterium]|jgi:hypothetical protein|nr:ERF family protein [Rickettsiales bacterium]